jgi:hypothetical protein
MCLHIDPGRVNGVLKTRMLMNHPREKVPTLSLERECARPRDAVFELLEF